MSVSPRLVSVTPLVRRTFSVTNILSSLSIYRTAEQPRFVGAVAIDAQSVLMQHTPTTASPGLI